MEQSGTKWNKMVKNGTKRKKVRTLSKTKYLKFFITIALSKMHLFINSLKVYKFTKF